MYCIDFVITHSLRTLRYEQDDGLGGKDSFRAMKLSKQFKAWNNTSLYIISFLKYYINKQEVFQGNLFYILFMF